MTKCTECGVEIPTEERLCPTCEGPKVVDELGEDVSLRESISVRGRGLMQKGSSGRKRPSKEQEYRSDERWNGTDRLVGKLREIDREHDRYLEEIVDPNTGEILYRKDEKLSDHKGHGSDRRRNRE